MLNDAPSGCKESPIEMNPGAGCARCTQITCPLHVVLTILEQSCYVIDVRQNTVDEPAAHIGFIGSCQSFCRPHLRVGGSASLPAKHASGSPSALIMAKQDRGYQCVKFSKTVSLSECVPRVVGTGVGWLRGPEAISARSAWPPRLKQTHPMRPDL